MMRRLVVLLLLVPIVFVIASATTARQALAHNSFVDSNPAAGQSLDASPATWTVRFTKTVPLESASGSVINGDGSRTTLQPPRHGTSTNEIVFDLPGGLAGAVTARWKLVSADGHVITGRVGFAVNTPFVADEPSAGVVAGIPEPVRVGLRFANYLAIVLFGGILFVNLDIATGAISTRRGRRIALSGAGGLAAVPLIQFLVFVSDIRGESGGFGAAVSDAMSLTPGAMIGLRAVVGLVILVLIRRGLAQGAHDGALSILIGASAAMYLVALAYVGHSRSQSLPIVGVPIDALHTAAVAVWLGGLVTILVVVVNAVPADQAVSAFRRFGPVAERAVAVIAVTGVVQTTRLHGSGSTLVTSGHGLLLLLKVALVLVMIRLGARNRRVLTDHMAVTPADDRRTRNIVVRTSLTEAAYGLGVIAVTAVLVAVTPG